MAHVDAIIMSLIYYQICSIDPLDHYKIIYYYIATLYCEQLWHLSIILAKYSTHTATFYYCIQVRATYI